MPARTNAAAEPERVGDEQDDAARDRSRSDARTRIEASTVPMHGAAQTAKAPPSSAFEPRRRACCRSPGATARSGHGSSAHEREPEDDQHEAGDLELGRLVDRAPDGRGAGAEQDEDEREADDERHARERRSSAPTPRSPSRSISTAEIAER